VPEGAIHTTIHFDYNAGDRSLTQEEFNERQLGLAAELARRFGWRGRSRHGERVAGRPGDAGPRGGRAPEGAQEKNGDLDRRVADLEAQLAASAPDPGWERERAGIRRRVEKLASTLEDLLEE